VKLFHDAGVDPELLEHLVYLGVKVFGEKGCVRRVRALAARLASISGFSAPAQPGNARNVALFA